MFVLQRLFQTQILSVKLIIHPHSAPSENLINTFLVHPPQSLVSCVRLLVTPWTAARQAPLSMGILQARILEWVAMPSSRGSSQPRDQTQGDSSPSEPPGKPKNIGVGSLIPSPGNFLTQELNQGLLHCRWILYQLSYQGS